MTIIECSRCLYKSNHPFGIEFNQEGVCSGCLVHDQKTNLDWNRQWSSLLSLIDRSSKLRNKSDYDCIVPIRGTPEYFYALHLLVDILGLRVLAVSYNSQFNSLVGVQNIALIREKFDIDFLSYTSNPLIYKKLVRESIVRRGSLRWPFSAGETQFAISTAINKQIPFIFWPVNQQTEQVGSHGYDEFPEMSRVAWHNYDLMGLEPKELLSSNSLINQIEIEDLNYPDDRQINKIPVRGLYLSNYVAWDSRLFAEKAVSDMGALASENTRTFDTYDRIDDITYMSLHDELKNSKFGYSRVTDSLSRELRFGRLEKSTASNLDSYYRSQNTQKEYQPFLDWLGINQDSAAWLLKWNNAQNTFWSDRHGETKSVELTQESISFISSFIRNTDSVHSSGKMYLFEKGID